MSNDTPRPRFPAGLNAEEKRAWAGFYARVGKDPLLAAELIAQLDKDAELKRAHLALYMSSKEAMRVHQHRQTRNRRIAHAIRWAFHLLVAAPIAWLLRGVHRSAEIAVATLPEEGSSAPVLREIHRTAHNGAFAISKMELDKQQQQHTG